MEEYKWKGIPLEATWYAGMRFFKQGKFDKWQMKGHIKLVLSGENGEVKFEYEGENTLTVLYDATAADLLAGGADVLVGWMSVGTATGGKTTASTALEGQIGTRYALDNGTPTQGIGAAPGGADNDVVYQRTFAAGEGTGSIMEVGMFQTQATATMMAYYDGFGQIDKAAADSLAVTWTVQHGAS